MGVVLYIVSYKVSFEGFLSFGFLGGIEVLYRDIVGLGIEYLRIEWKTRSNEMATGMEQGFRSQLWKNLSYERAMLKRHK